MSFAWNNVPLAPRVADMICALIHQKGRSSNDGERAGSDTGVVKAHGAFPDVNERCSAARRLAASTEPRIATAHAPPGGQGVDR